LQRAFVATLALAVCGPLYTGAEGQLLLSNAYAQSKLRTAQAQRTQKSPADQLRSQVETLINRLRGRDMPEGIVKSNGRIEATQVDVSAKYPGRLATLTVNEGDEVTAGQVVIAGNRSPAQGRAGPGVESETGAGISCRSHRTTEERLGFYQNGL
jgi:multidrug efflux pump subunit AcrA (membrane-fusion protein)